MPDSTLFATKMDAWNASQELPWNRLRYTLVHENLVRHLGPPPLRILDVGGGDGRDAVPLAELGHTVVLVDFVADMFEGALRRAADAGVGARMTIMLGDVMSVSRSLVDTEPAFDAVLCHNLLQYVPAPGDLLRQLAQLLRPDGLLSLLLPNPASDSYRLALQELDFGRALAALDATTHTVALYGAEVKHFYSAELDALLGAAGLAAATRYGIRCVIDYIHDNDIKYAPAHYQTILALERALSQRSPYREVARFHQVIARHRA